MTLRLLLPVLAALLAGCAGLIGVEPLSGGDAGPDAASDAGIADTGPGGADATDAGIAADAPGEAAPCSVTWVDASGGAAPPPGAINAEPLGEAGIAIYVCRTQVGSDVIPGKLLPGYGCYYGDGVDAGWLSGDYQVLVPSGCTVAWQASPSGIVPAGAVAGGQDSQGPLYSCRVEQPASDVGELGHMGWGTNHLCVYTLSQLSLSTGVFDVLTLQ
jgi:hypothetical protein